MKSAIFYLLAFSLLLHACQENSLLDTDPTQPLQETPDRFNTASSGTHFITPGNRFYHGQTIQGWYQPHYLERSPDDDLEKRGRSLDCLIKVKIRLLQNGLFIRVLHEAQVYRHVDTYYIHFQWTIPETLKLGTGYQIQFFMEDSCGYFSSWPNKSPRFSIVGLSHCRLGAITGLRPSYSPGEIMSFSIPSQSQALERQLQVSFYKGNQLLVKHGPFVIRSRRPGWHRQPFAVLLPPDRFPEGQGYRMMVELGCEGGLVVNRTYRFNIKASRSSSTRWHLK